MAKYDPFNEHRLWQERVGKETSTLDDFVMENLHRTFPVKPTTSPKIGNRRVTTSFSTTAPNFPEIFTGPIEEYIPHAEIRGKYIGKPKMNDSLITQLAENIRTQNTSFNFKSPSLKEKTLSRLQTRRASEISYPVSEEKKSPLKTLSQEPKKVSLQEKMIKRLEAMLSLERKRHNQMQRKLKLTN